MVVEKKLLYFKTENAEIKEAYYVLFDDIKNKLNTFESCFSTLGLYRKGLISKDSEFIIEENNNINDLDSSGYPMINGFIHDSYLYYRKAKMFIKIKNRIDRINEAIYS
jgi:hypothetical protein